MKLEILPKIFISFSNNEITFNALLITHHIGFLKETLHEALEKNWENESKLKLKVNGLY